MSYGIQVHNTWVDYPSWDDWDETRFDKPLRFETKDEAQWWINEMVDKEYKQQHLMWQKRYTVWTVEKYLYQKRKKVLMDAGLYEPGILVGWMFVDREPVLSYDGYRVVNDEEMNYPESEW